MSQSMASDGSTGVKHSLMPLVYLLCSSKKNDRWLQVAAALTSNMASLTEVHYEPVLFSFSREDMVFLI